MNWTEHTLNALPATLAVGDKVVRILGESSITMPLTITAIDEQHIHCGPWKFDCTHGYEVDEDLQWGVINPATGRIMSGSFILPMGVLSDQAGPSQRPGVE